jgi:ribonucleotide reductase alpha subunit
MFKNNFQKEVWIQNYKAPNEKKIEDTWKRIAKATSEIEKDSQYWTNKFYDLLYNFKFVPGGRISANIGVNDRKETTLFNCYVHNPKDINFSDPDSIEGIVELVKKQALTLKSEGGYGMNFSWIRPSGTYINGIGSRTPGVLKFMELWDKSSEIITMGTTKRYGEIRKNEKLKIRKGAQMGVLNCFSENTEILTSTGWVDIVDIINKVSDGEKILALDKDGEPHEIYNPIIKDPDQLYEIETEDGAIVQITADHKFEVYNINTKKTYLKAISDVDIETEMLISLNNQDV